MSDEVLLARAAAAYRRAGAMDAAARCYQDAGAHVMAADLYVHQRRYERAARHYVLGARSSVAAWVHAHHLGRTDLARDIVADGDAGRMSLRRVLEGIAHRRPALAPETWPLFPADTDIDTLVSSTLAAIGDELPAARRQLEQWQRDRHAGEVEPAVPDLVNRLIIARCDVADRVQHHDVLPVLAASRDALAARGPFADTIEEWSIAIAEEIHRHDQTALIFAAAVRAGSPGAATRWREWSARVLGAELVLPGVGGEVERD